MVHLSPTGMDGTDIASNEASPEPSEDIAPLAKGTLVHSMEEHLLTLLGIQIGEKPLVAGAPMHLNVPLSDQEIWESMLEPGGFARTLVSEDKRCFRSSMQ